MYDSAFGLVKRFTDPNVAAGYAPFNVQNLDGTLHVTYALQDAAKHDDVAGAGNGYVDAFSLNGTFGRRIVSQGGQVDSPWGLDIAPAGFRGLTGDLPVGNFGDGTISAFNATTGAFEGQLRDAKGAPIVEGDLSGLINGNGGQGGAANTVYFTAGLSGEAHGLLGGISAIPEPGGAAAPRRRARPDSPARGIEAPGRVAVRPLAPGGRRTRASGMSRPTVYGDSISGNCLKVKWTLDHLGVAFNWVETGVLNGETRTPAFLALNPAGQVPLVVLADGRPLAQSGAILLHFAEGSALIPADPYERALMLEWMFWEQYSHEPYVAVARFQVRYLGKSPAELDPKLLARAHGALTRLEVALTDRDFLLGAACTLADIALVAYTRVAPEGGIDLAPFAAVRGWIARVEAALGVSG
jgi:glutathione S-transferase